MRAGDAVKHKEHDLALDYRGLCLICRKEPVGSSP